MTVWTSNTCGCRIRFFDGSEKVVMDWAETKRTCSDHSLLTGQRLYEAALADNRCVQFVKDLADTMFPQMKITSADLDDGAPEIPRSWVFNTQRQLTVTYPTLTRLEKAELQDACDMQFGLGRVSIG